MDIPSVLFFTSTLLRLQTETQICAVFISILMLIRVDSQLYVPRHSVLIQYSVNSRCSNKWKDVWTIYQVHAKVTPKNKLSFFPDFVPRSIKNILKSTEPMDCFKLQFNSLKMLGIFQDSSANIFLKCLSIIPMLLIVKLTAMSIMYLVSDDVSLEVLLFIRSLINLIFF